MRMLPRLDDNETRKAYCRLNSSLHSSINSSINSETEDIIGFDQASTAPHGRRRADASIDSRPGSAPTTVEEGRNDHWIQWTAG